MSFLPALRKTLTQAQTVVVTDVEKEQNKVHELLAFLGFGLRSFNNLHQLLELIPIFASRINEADGGVVILFKPDGKMSLESLQCHGKIALQCEQLRKCLEQEIQLLAHSIEILDQVVGRVLGASQLFQTPILIKNAVGGRLYVFSYDRNYRWTSTKQRLLRLIADQTAVALEHNALTSELLKKESLDRELEIGAEIQRQLLPRTCPKIPGLQLAARYLTANRVGGDYYDFIPICKGQRWGIVVGDVMGKGVPAGLIMTMTRGMLRAEVLNGHSPGVILEHLNQIMFDDLEKSHRFVTMFYSEYNPISRVLAFSNAAHLPALLWRSQTATIQSLDTLGSLIGLDSGSKYAEDAVILEAGDVVIFYTDGFTEAANTKGDRFDEENLRFYLKQICQKAAIPHKTTAVGSQVILDYIFEKLQNFVGREAVYGDDMTLIVLQVEAGI